MLTAETVHAEGARYAASVVCVPGLWTGPGVWRAFAGHLGNRGWECHLLDTRGLPGGIAARATAVAEYAAGLATPPILVAQDTGAPVALAAAAQSGAAAVVLIAPLPPGSRGARLLVLAPRPLLALVVGGEVPPPSGRASALWLDLPEPVRSAAVRDLAPDDAMSVRDVVWGRVELGSTGTVPTLVLAGARDRLVAPEASAALARATGAELRVLEGAGHWALAAPGWQDTAALVHRWLVQRLGAPLLELYAEAMAERETEEGE